MDLVRLTLFSNRIRAVCDEMGAVLRCSAFSPNIRDRLDYSCAVFDEYGAICAQAAHIPVHLGSMAYAMKDVVSRFDWQAGDIVAFNDPYLGGTHLPDVTLVAPVIRGDDLLGFVANRAHHADIGAESPGSMPISESLKEEGRIISPVHLARGGRDVTQVVQQLTESSRNPVESRGDFAAQASSVRTGARRLRELIENISPDVWRESLLMLNRQAETMTRHVFSGLPHGCFTFTDYMDDDGLGNRDIPIHVALDINETGITIDFTGTARQVKGNINCPISVAAAAVYYVFRCLMPDEVPLCAGAFAPLTIHAEKGSLVNAHYPAAVAAGNVETSTRIVDTLLGALAQALPDRIPAASHGSMNNIAMGSNLPGQTWDYYETTGGGMGASHGTPGLSAVHTHMTNTLNTPVESLEMNFPLRVTRYEIRDHSGGTGKWHGGDGIIREYEFLNDAEVTILSERRRHRPWGLQGGGPGMAGVNLLNDEPVAGKVSLKLGAGDRLRIESAGGGGFGKP